MPKKYTSLLILLLFLQSAFAQEKLSEIKISGSFRETSMADFFQELHSTYQIDFYYQSDWIDSLQVNRNFQSMSLEQVLNKIFEGTSVDYRFFQDDAVVLIPRTASRKYFIENEDLSLLVIGEPVNEGRYKTATIHGTVVDGKTGDRLPGAVILNHTTGQGSSTDKNGDFEIALPTGEYQLQVSFMGFEPLLQRVKLIEDGEVIFDLFEETHNIEEITITASDQAGTRSQMSMVKVKAKSIKELPVLMGEADVIKSVVMMPGIQSVGELSSGFNVRGGNTDQNLVLVDGATIFNTSHLFGFFSMINPDAVEDVTIYKGGMPASYGERVSSVMDILLKEGNTERTELYGGLGLINSRATLEGPFIKDKKSSFLIGGRSTYSDWIMHEIKDIQFQKSTAQFYDLNANVNFHFEDKNDLKIMGYMSGDKFNLDTTSLYNYTNTLASLNWTDSWGEKVTSSLSASYSNYDFTLSETSDKERSLDYDLLTGIENAGAKYTLAVLPSEKWKLEGGFQSTAYRIHPGEIKPSHTETQIIPEKVNEEKGIEWAGFFSTDFDVSDRIVVSLGSRFSNFMKLGESTVYLYDESKTISEENVVDSLYFGKNEVVKKYHGIEPRVSLKYNLTAYSSIRWSYQRVYQYLNQISNTSVVSPADFWKASGYYTKPLIADQFAVGYFQDLREHKLEASAEIYYKQLQNLLEYKNGAQLVMNHHLETDIIQADGYAYGLELLLKKTAGRLNGWLSYAYSKTMRKTDNDFDEEMINHGDYYPSVYDKPHDISVIANYQISRRWRASCNFVFASGRPTTLPELKYSYGGEQIVYYSDRNEYRMPPYHRFDISITLDENLRKKRMWKGSWTLSIYNLYGRKNPYSVYYQRHSEKNPASGLSNLYKFSVIGIPIPSLTYNFRF